MMGKFLIIVGALLIVAGLLVILRVPIPFGRLPGDIVVTGKHVSFYFPIVTCLILSIVLSLLFYFFSRHS